MIRKLVLVWAFVCAAFSAGAQTLTVRSGEHGAYTRLVVQIPPGTEWKLDPKPDGATLDVALTGVVFDTKSVFQRLSTGRLEAVSQNSAGEALDLRFGCQCVAKAFLHRGTMVVIDVAPGEAVLPETIDTKSPFWTIPDRPNPKETPELPALALDLPLLDLSRRDLEAQVMSRILQGADRDVADLTLSEPGPRLSAVPRLAPSSINPIQNIGVSSILDEFQDLGDRANPNILHQPKCITNAELAFDSWSDARPFQMQVAALRKGLFQEFDHVNEDRTIKLAKLYTFFGFGAEAIQVLKLLPQQSTEAARISAIAKAMDGEVAMGQTPFSGQQACGGDAGLWALLTGQSVASDIDLNSIEQSFARLPAHLRRHFGPKLAEALTDAGNLEAARRVLRSVDRVEHPDSSAARLAQAKVADAGGETERTEALLSEVTATADAGRDAALALARLIEKRWSDRGSVSPREIELAAAYSVEFRNSDYGPMMARAHALAMALNREFIGAFRGVQQSPLDKDWRRTLNQVTQLLAERADNITFLYQTVAMPTAMQSKLDTNTAVSVSDRLISLGFGEQAMTWSNRPSDKTRRKDRTLLRAQAAALNGRPRQALLELQDDDSERANRLKADALIQAGDFAQAAAVLAELGEVDRAQRLNWLSDQVENADPGAPGKYSELTKIEYSLSLPPERLPDKPLADAKALLEGSVQARALIGEMLDLTGSDVTN
ncbi:hypothetical protein RA28_11420 [Ruegeria sp. ANG-S4]|uniref:hypothetical protein n=1 Tax=Ruegeria sp. ANG-S4 TaxID=1577904 RepID=UPI00057E81B8|nr:hypothetical protein [Ruegeria sp. ANG-S4]KIC45090.1 hypothetical protein RA28_11420 [Ruegeria sp. ANG-S4]